MKRAKKSPVKRAKRGLELRLLNLKCRQTSDRNGVDEPMLQVKGSSLECLLRPKITAGQTWKLNESFPFTRAAVIELWDIDSRDGAPGNDDIIGVHVVRSSEARLGKRTAFFAELGGQYELTYQVR